jgi:outer membrane protein assembly factor BamA
LAALIRFFLSILIPILLGPDFVSAQKINMVLYETGLNKPITSKSVNSLAAADKEISDALKDCYRLGYLAASIDSVRNTNDTLIYWLNKGKTYTWVELSKGNVADEALRFANYRSRNFRNTGLKFDKAATVLERSLEWYENNGYPFAALYLDSIRQESNTIYASIHVKPGNKIVYDSVTWRGNARISKSYLYNYLGIKPGNTYNEQALLRLKNRLNELPFVTQTKPAEVFFLEESALLRMHLNARKASNFSGMIGFLPNTGKDNRLLITGEANLKLRNALGRSEAFDLDWKRLQPSTQSLSIKASWPFIFQLPFGLDGQFNLFKRDSTFLNIIQGVGVQYLMSGTDYLKAFVEQRISSLLPSGISSVTNGLPDYSDVKSTSYGLEFNFTRLDYRWNPRRGIKLLVKSGIGTRKINLNSLIDNEESDVYPSKSLQINAYVDFDGFIPLFRQSTLNIGATSAYLNATSLFENELYRIGGVSSLRGFDEESIFASSFSIINLEYRYLLEQNSFLFLFTNAAWYENYAVNRSISDTPYGFGTGISFETKAGIFTVSYALGSQFGQTPQVRSAKIHFGISSLF